MTAKSWYQSKTVWLAVAQAVAGGFVIFQSTFPNVGWLMLGKSIIDVIVRYYTTGPMA